MASKVELGSLLDLAIGKPDTGTVNFKALHSFLHKLIGHLAVSKVEVEVSIDRNDEKDGSNSKMDLGGNSSAGIKLKQDSELFHGGGAVEKRINNLEGKMDLLDSFAGTDDIMNWARGREKSTTKVADMWNFINFQKRVEASENGVQKVGSMVDQILQNLSELRNRTSQLEKKTSEFEKLQEEVRNLSEKINGLGDKKVEDLMNDLNEMKLAMATKQDLSLYVKWPDLLSALETGKISESGEKFAIYGESSALKSELDSQNIGRDSVQLSRHPSDKVLHKLGEVGSLSKTQLIIQEDVENVKQELNKKASKADLDALASREIPEDLIEQLEGLQNDLNSLKLWRQGVDEDMTFLGSMKVDFAEMKRNIEKLQTKMRHAIEEHSRKQVQIDSLFNKTDNLEEVKADKEGLDIQLSQRVDKAELENFVSRSRFDSNIGRIDDTLKEFIDEAKSNDESRSKIIAKLLSDMLLKMDRDEFVDFKEKLESRLKAMKLKMKEETVMDIDPAAAFKKALLQFNCLSCDRPVYFSGSGPIQGYSGFSATKSGRPYTSYDLEHVRQLQKGSLKPECTDYTFPRSCGGSHTSGNPTRRISAKLVTSNSGYEEVPVQPPVPPRNEVEIQGQDGKLYKGRVDKNGEFAFAKNGRVKPKSAHGMRSPNSYHNGEGNLVPRRPKTAVNRSLTPEMNERLSIHGRVPSPDSSVCPDESVANDDLLL